MFLYYKQSLDFEFRLIDNIKIICEFTVYFMQDPGVPSKPKFPQTNTGVMIIAVYWGPVFTLSSFSNHGNDQSQLKIY